MKVIAGGQQQATGAVFSLGRLGIRSPQNHGLNKKKVRDLFVTIPRTICDKSVINQPQSPTQSPCNMYIGENFSVTIPQYFHFAKLIDDNSLSGIAHCSFDPFKTINKMSLSADAEKILTVPNAGGNSVISEVVSCELLKKCFQARLIKTEMEVDYFPEGGSITDYVCEIFRHKVGVSVTRAMKYFGKYTEEDAEHLLMKKLKGVIQSSRNTLENWNKQILHVWAQSNNIANTITKVYHTLPNEIRANTVVLVTTTNANFIFDNR